MKKWILTIIGVLLSILILFYISINSTGDLKVVSSSQIDIPVIAAYENGNTPAKAISKLGPGPTVKSNDRLYLNFSKPPKSFEVTSTNYSVQSDKYVHDNAITVLKNDDNMCIYFVECKWLTKTVTYIFMVQIED